MIKEFLRFWTPAEKFRQLALLDAEAPSYSLPRLESLRRIHYTVFAICLCLLFTYYGKYYEFFTGANRLAAQLFGFPPQALQGYLKSTGYEALARYAWWSMAHVTGFVLMPWIFIRWVLKDSIINYGWRWQQTHQHWQGYLFLLLPIIGMVYFASQRSDFIHHYPFYQLSRRSISDLLAWEFFYLLQFISLEFFFRGFIIQALRPAIGANAIWLMVAPYLMIHFGKPWLEATGAIFFGLFLGLLAMRSGSIWGGFFVHCGVALSMDIAAMIQQGGLPTEFWPHP